MWLGSAVGTTCSSIELAGLLFSEYVAGELFRDEMLYSLCRIDFTFLFTKSSPSIKRFAGLYFRALSEYLTFRAVESVVVASFCHGTNFMKDAVAFHFLFPFLQKYRFDRLWITRAMRGVGKFMFPSFLRSLAFGKDAKNEALQAVGPTGSMDHLPAEVQNALQFYLYSYQSSVAYSVVSANFVHEVTLFITEQLFWAATFYHEQSKRTSVWRMLKPYVCLTTHGLVQSVLGTGARILGAWAGKKLGSDATGSSIFWGERIGLLLAVPLIDVIANSIVDSIRVRLEKNHPSTIEDEMEDNREREEAEEQEQIPSSAPPRNGGVTSTVDLYEVLGVTPKSTPAEVKRSYRQLALKNHPDRVPNNTVAQTAARQQMAVINEAYEVLSNSNKKAQYDASRTAMGDATPILQMFENLSPTSKTILTSSGAVVLFYASSVVVYGHYCAGFISMTDSGRVPLRMFM